MSALQEALHANTPLILDGAMGTMLQARGLAPGANPERFCLENPQVLKNIHKEYIDAGADIVLTGTFGGSRFKLPSDLSGNGQGGEGVVAFNRQMAMVAKTAAKEAARRVFVGGDLGPCGHFVRPVGELAVGVLYEAYKEQVRGLMQGGVDFIMIETQFDLAEARIAVAAVRAESDLPVFVSMTFEQGVSLTGTTPEIFAATMRNLGVDAVGLNCGAGPEEMAPLVDRFLANAGLPILVEPNAGLPELIDGETRFRLPAEPFARQTAAFVEKGVNCVGGCCGTTPEHIFALRKAVDSVTRQTSTLTIPVGVAVTSRTQLVRFAAHEPLKIIGERINPTGKKALQAELQAGTHALALRFAKEQVALGAHVLDVNVGAPMVDETTLLPALVENLVGSFAEPLSLDTSNIDAMAAALPLTPGSPLVNSISGEHGRMKALGPLCRQWGAPFVLLPLQGSDLPVLASQRIAILEKLLEQAEALGIPRHLIMVDVLALSVAANNNAGREALETIRWCTSQNLPTVMGLSNISFGLPARELVNTVFLGMSMGAGLTGCIANPSSVRLLEVAGAGNVLLEKDPGATAFVQHFANWAANNEHNLLPVKNEHAAISSIEDAVLQGEKDSIIPLVQDALSQGNDPFTLVNERLIPAITEVGARYERKEYFLPQLLRSAETMQTAFAHLRPLLEDLPNAGKKPVIVLATVEGDIHDIGKNIVGLMLGNHGFTVIDLGKDVKAQTIVDAAIEHKAAIIGLSALMTTTMVRMEDTIKLVQEQNLNVKVMVGGAVVTRHFADSIKAHGYSVDAVEAVRVAQNLCTTAGC